MAAGDFSASVLAEVKLKMDNMWGADNMVNPDYQADCETARVIMGEQTANVSELETGKDGAVTVTWIKPTTPAVVDAGDDCNIGGDEKESVKMSYDLGFRKTTGFSIKEKDDRSNIIEQDEKIANGFLTSMKALDEQMAQTIIAKIEAFKGVNQLTTGMGNVVGSETYVEPAKWDSNVFAYLKRVGLNNKLSSPFLLNGSNLYEQYLNANFEAGNADGKGDSAKFGSLRMYWDELNIDAANGSDFKSYLINRGALAFASKAYYRDVNGGMVDYVHGANQKRFAMESSNLPGVWYDVHYNNSCSEDDIKHNWSFHVKYDCFNNPIGAISGRTGVLSFINGVAA